ncbi:MAG: DUF86 domain-containing protein [Candidatus Thiothrix sulfatifontis]|nr:MAG: DUF86 domain-containing protein [Candidatus Thiothrix sulfatifontis]
MLDSVLNKKDSLERCIQQIHTYYALPADKPFAQDFMKQDAISINLQRAAQLCIDLANITIRSKKLGLPKDSSDSFTLLVEASIIDNTMGQHLKGMVGFRNILVHEYTKLDLSIMVDVIENHLEELIDFAQLILLKFKDDNI